MGSKYCNSACSSFPRSGEPSTLVSSTAVYDSSSFQKTKTHFADDMAAAIDREFNREKYWTFAKFQSQTAHLKKTRFPSSQVEI